MAGTKQAVHVPFDEFSKNLTGFFDRIIHGHETVVVEKEAGAGVVEGVVLKPLRLAAGRKGGGRKRSDADYDAFLSSFGAWSDVDVDDFMKRVYESRT